MFWSVCMSDRRGWHMNEELEKRDNGFCDYMRVNEEWPAKRYCQFGKKC